MDIIAPAETGEIEKLPRQRIDGKAPAPAHHDIQENTPVPLELTPHPA
jgi:hypothetical protein